MGLFELLGKLCDSYEDSEPEPEPLLLALSLVRIVTWRSFSTAIFDQIVPGITSSVIVSQPYFSSRSGTIFGSLMCCFFSSNGGSSPSPLQLVSDLINKSLQLIFSSLFLRWAELGRRCTLCHSSRAKSDRFRASHWLNLV